MQAGEDVGTSGGWEDRSGCGCIVNTARSHRRVKSNEVCGSGRSQGSHGIEAGWEETQLKAKAPVDEDAAVTVVSAARPRGRTAEAGRLINKPDGEGGKGGGGPMGIKHVNLH